MRAPSKEEIAGALTLGLACFWLFVFARIRIGFVAGDPLAVYFPIVQNLLDGHGVAGFAPLYEGAGRQPGYALALIPFAVVFGELIVAARVLGVVSALLVLLVLFDVLRRNRAPLLAIVGSIALTAVTPAFVLASTEPLPDMLFLAAFALIFWLIAFDARVEKTRTRGGLAFAAGAVAGLATLLRLNGLGLALGVPVALLANDRSKWMWRIPLSVCGFALFYFPIMSLLSSGLAEYGIPYPRGSQEILFVPKEDQSPLDALIEPYQVGLEQLFDRMSALVTLAPATFGLAAVVYAAFKTKMPEAKTLFWLTGSVIGMLIPLHFEPRYWLPVVPGLFAAFTWAGQVLLARLELRRRTELLLLGLAIVWIGYLQGTKSVEELEVTSNASAEIWELCRSLERDAQREGLVIVGADGNDYWYSAFRECPTPMRDHARFTLVPAYPTTQGLDYWIQNGALQVDAPLDPVASSGGFTLYRAKERPQDPAPEGTELLSSLAIDLPRHPQTPCMVHHVVLPPEATALGFQVTTDHPLAAWIIVRSDAGEWTISAVGERVLRRLAVPSTNRQVELVFCPSDAIRSPGRIAIDRVWAIR